eukprot:TRINITY_DN15635_c0_g1_i2.p1 TRINITY_DN15635_c0_g1~~TRINITY_DN15635_c0_g1_i2.p1  ORF type:complete len:1213 (+),score=154.00 TRINITY_DN15635_c0_g1_i2:32-3640(+)
MSQPLPRTFQRSALAPDAVLTLTIVDGILENTVTQSCVVIATLGDETYTTSPSPESRGCTPGWNETVRFNLEQYEGIPALQLQLRSDDGDLLGEGTLDVAALPLELVTAERWIPLTSLDYREAMGRIRVSVSCTKRTGQPKARDSTPLWLKQCGTLEITVVDARGLVLPDKGTSLLGTRKIPFVRLMLKGTTGPLCDTLDPIWNERYLIPFPPTPPRTLELQVEALTEDVIGSSTIGTATVDLTSWPLEEFKPAEKWIVINRGEKPVGRVRLHVQARKGDGNLPTKPPLPPTSSRPLRGPFQGVDDTPPPAAPRDSLYVTVVSAHGLGDPRGAVDACIRLSHDGEVFSTTVVDGTRDPVFHETHKLLLDPRKPGVLRIKALDKGWLAASDLGAGAVNLDTVSPGDDVTVQLYRGSQEAGTVQLVFHTDPRPRKRDDFDSDDEPPVALPAEWTELQLVVAEAELIRAPHDGPLDAYVILQLGGDQIETTAVKGGLPRLRWNQFFLVCYHPKHASHLRVNLVSRTWMIGATEVGHGDVELPPLPSRGLFDAMQLTVHLEKNGHPVGRLRLFLQPPGSSTDGLLNRDLEVEAKFRADLEKESELRRKMQRMEEELQDKNSRLQEMIEEQMTSENMQQREVDDLRREREALREELEALRSKTSELHRTVHHGDETLSRNRNINSDLVCFYVSVLAANSVLHEDGTECFDPEVELMCGGPSQYISLEGISSRVDAVRATEGPQNLARHVIHIRGTVLRIVLHDHNERTEKRIYLGETKIPVVDIMGDEQVRCVWVNLAPSPASLCLLAWTTEPDDPDSTRPPVPRPLPQMPTPPPLLRPKTRNGLSTEAATSLENTRSFPDSLSHISLRVVECRINKIRPLETLSVVVKIGDLRRATSVIPYNEKRPLDWNERLVFDVPRGASLPGTMHVQLRPQPNSRETLSTGYFDLAAFIPAFSVAGSVPWEALVPTHTSDNFLLAQVRLRGELFFYSFDPRKIEDIEIEIHDAQELPATNADTVYIEAVLGGDSNQTTSNRAAITRDGLPYWRWNHKLRFYKPSKLHLRLAANVDGDVRDREVSVVDLDLSTWPLEKLRLDPQWITLLDTDGRSAGKVRLSLWVRFAGQPEREAERPTAERTTMQKPQTRLDDGYDRDGDGDTASLSRRSSRQKKPGADRLPDRAPRQHFLPTSDFHFSRSRSRVNPAFFSAD